MTRAGRHALVTGPLNHAARVMASGNRAAARSIPRGRGKAPQHHPVAPAFGFRLDAGGVSVTISGDTGPCGNLERLANGTDLLLHEAIDIDSILAVYAKDRPETAEAMRDHHMRAHTTPQQAADIAARAGAKTLALHHLVPGDADFGSLIPTSGFDGPIHLPDDLAVFDLTGDTAHTK